MEILEAYDLTKSYRAAAALIGCDHHTVKRYVSARAAGLDPTSAIGRPRLADAFAAALWLRGSISPLTKGVAFCRLRRPGRIGTLGTRWRRPQCSRRRSGSEALLDSPTAPRDFVELLRGAVTLGVALRKAGYVDIQRASGPP